MEIKGFKISFFQFCFLISGVLIIIALTWFYIFYPTVTVEIQPVVRKINNDISLKGSLNANTINVEKELIPLYKRRVTVIDDYQTEPSGTKIIGIEPARGKVSFFNERNDEVFIPEGTIIETEQGIQYKTQKGITIPEKQKDYIMEVKVGVQAGRKDVEVEAIEKGERGNIGPGEINNFTSAKEQVHVINSEAIEGGKSQQISVVNKNDIEDIKNNLRDKIKTGIWSNIYQKYGGNYRILDDSIDYDNIEYSFDKDIGEKAELIKAEGVLYTDLLLLNSTELDQYLLSKFLSENGEEYRLVEDKIDINKINVEQTDQDLYNINVEAVIPAIADKKFNELNKKIAGKDIEKVEKYLSSNKDIKEFEIYSSKEVLPVLSFAITVIVDESESIDKLLSGG